MATKDLLIEIGTEELPPKVLEKLSLAWQDGFQQALKKANLAFETIEAFATPRRLALLVTDLEMKQADQVQQRLGPAADKALDSQGKPTPAAQGFAKSCGVEFSDLKEIETPKGARLGIELNIPGKITASMLPQLFADSLRQLPIPKLMRWGTGDAQFTRPVQWLTVLLGKELIPVEGFGITSERNTYGHRFHAPKAISLKHPKDYSEILQDAKVIASFQRRKQSIVEQVEEVSSRINARVIIDSALLDEVSALVEWPQAIVGEFDESFLTVPKECLISAMQGHQKYFHVVDNNDENRLLPYFVTIANIESKNPDSIKLGNEKVIRARLSDAKFFYDQDRNKKLEDFGERLANVVFQKDLGTVADKVDRVVELTADIAVEISGDPNMARRAARLAKCDLATDMVGEFPELQGLMGYYYALADGETQAVAEAIRSHYQPRFAGDAIPEDKNAVALALAEKIDTLVGIMGVGLIPSGNKDPFSLRRAALGVLRLLIENNLALSMVELIDKSIKRYKSIELDKNTPKLVFEFVEQRLKAYYQDLGVETKTINAVLNKQLAVPRDFHDRVMALKSFQHNPACEALAAATKRVANILKKADKVENRFHTNLLEKPEEMDLVKAMHALSKQEHEQYEEKLAALASLREPIDNFFVEVVVNVEDESIKKNRLGLLSRLHQVLTQVADISSLDA